MHNSLIKSIISLCQACSVDIVPDLRDYSAFNAGYDEFQCFIKQACRLIIVRRPTDSRLRADISDDYQRTRSLRHA